MTKSPDARTPQETIDLRTGAGPPDSRAATLSERSCRLVRGVGARSDALDGTGISERLAYSVTECR
jgi:hypothetical protein